MAGQGAPTVQQRKRKNAVAESSDGEESAEEAVQGHQVEEEEEVDELAGESLEAVPRPVVSRLACPVRNLLSGILRRSMPGPRGRPDRSQGTTTNQKMRVGTAINDNDDR